MMIAASLMWAGAAEKPEQSKLTFKNHQNDSKQLTYGLFSLEAITMIMSVIMISKS